MNRYRLLILVGTAILTSGIIFAAFGDKGKVLGSSFSVGSADLKILVSLNGGTGINNLADELIGPIFTNITPNWQQDYLLKLTNKGTTTIQLATTANYDTANDPDDLRNYIYVEPIPWNDANNSGNVDTGEEGTPVGKKTIVKWKTEGFILNDINVNEIAGYILRFSTGTLSDTKQGKTGVFDFEFDALGQ